MGDLLLTKREKYNILRSQLIEQRSSFIPDWQELIRYVAPRRGRFLVTDVNRGGRRGQQIIDSTATISLRTLRSGMMSGITSPARPWFKLGTPDPSLSDQGDVKDWLYFVGQRMATVFGKSNLYNVLPIIYGDMGLLATSALGMEEDFQDVVRFYPFPIGSYCIANNDRLKVDVFHREFQMTVRQLVARFGRRNDPEIVAGKPYRSGAVDWSNFSPRVKNYWDTGQYETFIQVTHVIEPNIEYDPRKLASKYKKYASSYFEAGMTAASGTQQTDPESQIFLSEMGYNYFPVLCPRWETTGEDSYGTSCPGMDALGDIKQLQLGEKRTAQAIEKMINPPMVGPTILKSAKSTILPGDITFLDGANQTFKPAHEIQPRIQEMEGKQGQVRDRIKRVFFEDLFLMMSESDRRDITATEIDERKEEKLLALGPVLEQLNQDLLDPLIANTFAIMNRQGLIPPPPPALRGVPLRVEYISIMAQAQKLVGIESIEKFAGFVGQIMQVMPESNAADNVDVDQMIEVYGDQTSVPPGIVRSSDQIAAIRQKRSQAQAAQAQQQANAQAAQTAQTLSQTDTGGGTNALQSLMNQSKAGSLAPAT